MTDEFTTEQNLLILALASLLSEVAVTNLQPTQQSHGLIICVVTKDMFLTYPVISVVVSTYLIIDTVCGRMNLVNRIVIAV